MTPKRLGKILFEEFQRDGWGLMNPDSFEEPLTNTEENEGWDDAGLYEVLERASKRINKEIFKEAFHHALKPAK